MRVCAACVSLQTLNGCRRGFVRAFSMPRAPAANEPVRGWRRYLRLPWAGVRQRCGRTR